VKRGDLVTVTVVNDNLILTAKAKAKESGKKGDWIAVENIDTRRLILARITGPYRVEVLLSGK
jgi:flagella basal body P-ring formation protein FlgA